VYYEDQRYPLLLIEDCGSDSIKVLIVFSPLLYFAVKISGKKAVPKRTMQPSFFMMITDGFYHDNTFIHRRRENMAKTSQVPNFVRLGNMLTTTLLRAGFKLVGPGAYPMYLLTVRGRKSGLLRTVPIVILEHNGKRYLVSPYGRVDWVRNLQAAGEAILTRGRHSEKVKAKELPGDEAALVLQKDIKKGNPFARYYGVTAESSLEEFEHAATSHPMFLLQNSERL
jgi:deazaflavin-dependent oxidoreductase (nitroreductase family)